MTEGTVIYPNPNEVNRPRQNPAVTVDRTKGGTVLGGRPASGKGPKVTSPFETQN